MGCGKEGKGEITGGDGRCPLAARRRPSTARGRTTPARDPTGGEEREGAAGGEGERGRTTPARDPTHASPHDTQYNTNTHV